MPNTTESLTTLAHLGLKQWFNRSPSIDVKPHAEELIALAQQEKMTLALLGAFPTRKIPAAFSALNAKWQHNGEILARHLKALKHLSEQAAKENIRMIPLKGALFALINLPHAIQRIAGDVDIMIPRHQLESAVSLFRREGYQTEPHRSPHRWHAEILNRWLPFSSSVLGRDPLHGPEGSFDLHWDPVYLVGGSQVRFDLKRVWENATAPFSAFPALNTPPPAFTTAHVLVHAVHTAEEAGLTLMTLFDLAICLDKLPAPFETCLEYIRMESEAVVIPRLTEFWAAARALIEGELEPYFMLRNRKTFTKPQALPKPWLSTFGHIGSTKDRVKFLLGYVLPNSKSPSK